MTLRKIANVERNVHLWQMVLILITFKEQFDKVYALRTGADKTLTVKLWGTNVTKEPLQDHAKLALVNTLNFLSRPCAISSLNPGKMPVRFSSLL